MSRVAALFLVAALLVIGVKAGAVNFGTIGPTYEIAEPHLLAGVEVTERELLNLLKQGQTSLAEQQCRLQPSFLSYVLHAGLSELDGGWPVVEKAMEKALREGRQ